MEDRKFPQERVLQLRAQYQFAQSQQAKSPVRLHEKRCSRIDTALTKRQEPIQRLIDGLTHDDFRLKMRFETHALGATFSPNRSLLAITGPNVDGQTHLQIWRVEDGILLYRLMEAHSPVFSLDGRYLAVLSPSAALVLRPRSGKLCKTLALSKRHAKFIAFSPGSEILVAGGWSTRNDIKLWYASTGEEYTIFVPPSTAPMGAESHEKDEMIGLTFNSDGQRVLCATTFHTWSWDIAPGSLTDKPPTDEMGNLIKKENGKFALNGESIAFEPYRDWGCIFTGKSSGGPMIRLQACDSLILAWTLSSDGRVVVTATSEDTGGKILKFWDTVSGKLLYSTSTTCSAFIRENWYPPFDNIKGICFSADSSWMGFFGPRGVRIGPCGIYDEVVGRLV